MRVLVLCSRRDYSPHTDYMAPFVYEQMNALQSLGVDCKTVLVDGGGITAYLRAVKQLRKTIQDFSPHIIHAHYGLCGAIANFQRRVPVVTTYHGSDLHVKRLRIVSQFSVLLSCMNIVVSQDLAFRLFKQGSIRIIPCGIDTHLLVPMNKEDARMRLGMDLSKTYILFAKEFHNKAKNYPLAKSGVDEYNSKFANGADAELLEFIGYSREQVRFLYNAVDCVLMTSDHEGSPQFIKEAMACNCPVVSVDVGDVKQVISGIDGCYLAERDSEDIAVKLDLAVKHGRTKGRKKILKEYEAGVIAQKVVEVYNEVLDYE